MMWRAVGSPVVRYDLLSDGVAVDDFDSPVVACIGTDDGRPGTQWYGALLGEPTDDHMYPDAASAYADLAARIDVPPLELP